MGASVLDLKRGLLLIHGTTYGQERQAFPVVQFSDLSDSIGRHNYVGFDWDIDVPYVASFSTLGTGMVTDNTPIDVVHWGVNGIEPYDILSPWRGCMGLLVRL